jgi:hypothetical protein
MLWCLADFNNPDTTGPDERQAVQATGVSPRSVLRALVLGEAALTILAVAAELILEKTLPEPLRTYAASEDLPTWLTLAGLILMLLLVVSWVALWRLSPPAPLLYAAASAGLQRPGPVRRPLHRTGVGETLSTISSWMTGAILALVFLSPLREEFSRKHGFARESLGDTTLP